MIPTYPLAHLTAAEFEELRTQRFVERRLQGIPEDGARGGCKQCGGLRATGMAYGPIRCVECGYLVMVMEGPYRVRTGP